MISAAGGVVVPERLGVGVVAADEEAEAEGVEAEVEEAEEEADFFGASGGTEVVAAEGEVEVVAEEGVVVVTAVAVAVVVEGEGVVEAVEEAVVAVEGVRWRLAAAICLHSTHNTQHTQYNTSAINTTHKERACIAMLCCVVLCSAVQCSGRYRSNSDLSIVSCCAVTELRKETAELR